MNFSTSSNTVISDLWSGPKFQGPEYFALFHIFLARVRIPDIGSRTCCHGLTESGFLILTVSPLTIPLTRSGMILCGAQSPPPITFPDLTDEIPTSLSKKKTFPERVYNNVLT